MKCRIDFKMVQTFPNGKEVEYFFSAAGKTLGEAVTAAIMILSPHGGDNHVEVIRAGFFCESCKCYHSFDEAIVVHSEAAILENISGEN